MLLPADNPMMTRNSGAFTLIELIVATTISFVLSGMAIPMARVAIKRERGPPASTALAELYSNLAM